MKKIDDDKDNPSGNEVDAPEFDRVDFTADPANILPFGTSTLRWHVEGNVKFSAKINDIKVDPVGKREVQPTQTTVFQLSAYGHLPAGDWFKELGSVVVTVSMQDCETVDIFPSPPNEDLESKIQTYIKDAIQKQPDLYFREDPIASFTPGRIHLKLRLQKRMEKKPDPNMDIDASFGLSVRDGYTILVPPEIKAQASIPSWEWGIPFVSEQEIALLLAQANYEAEQTMRETLEGFPEGINVYVDTNRPGSKKLQAIHIVTDGNNGHIMGTYCPDPELNP